MNITFIKVLTTGHVENVVHLANIIWTQHYVPIIGHDQVNYMLNNFQSKQAIFREIGDKNNHYYLISKNQVSVGYLSMKLEKENLFLSKLYILHSERGNGIGKRSVAFIREFSGRNNFKTIRLTVNKNNTDSISAYKKIGFEISGKICVDIGEGYVMDDYQMTLNVKS